MFRPKTTPPMIKTDTFCDIVPFPGHGADAATFSHLLEGNLCLLHVIVDHVQPLLDPVQLLCTRGGSHTRRRQPFIVFTAAENIETHTHKHSGNAHKFFRRMKHAQQYRQRTQVATTAGHNINSNLPSLQLIS